MTNCADINGAPYHREHIKSMDENMQRAISFDLIAFKLPCRFDKGMGYDHIPDFWNGTPKAFSKDGCNWYQPYNGKIWDEEGIYSIETMKNEIEKYNNGEKTIIIDRQHFDSGLEMMDFDITSYFKDIANGEENYGIGIAFSPSFEETEKEISQYLGFFTENTNLFFHPYIEVIYNDYICDERHAFYVGKTNRLYLYASINGEMVNFDEMPICTIDGKEYEVKQASKGVYYAEISTQMREMSSNSIHYDIWSNLALNGQKIEDVEMDFVALAPDNYFNIGSNNSVRKNLTPSVYGINDAEELCRGEIREVSVEYRKTYSIDEKEMMISVVMNCIQ